VPDSSEPGERKRKTIVFHEGKEAATRFESAMRHLVTVPKTKLLKLEKKHKSKH
jgi:hypothetical protein